MKRQELRQLIREELQKLNEANAATDKDGNEIKPGMYINPPSDYDAGRPSKHRKRVKKIEYGSSPELSTIITTDGERYNAFHCYYPSKKA